MKKTILILFVSLLAVPLLTGIGFAGSTTIAHDADRTTNIADSGDEMSDCDISLSRNVSFGYATDDGTDQEYAITTLHWSGDKEYGTASDTTLIFWTTASTGNESGAPGGTDSTVVNEDDAGWNEL